MEPAAATYVASTRGKVLIDHHKFRYIKNNSNPKKTKDYYVCAEKKKLNCRATATVDVSVEPHMVTALKGEHSHDSSLVELKVREIERDAIKSVALNNTVTPRAVLGSITNQIAQQLPCGGIEAMKKTATLSKAVQREKVKAKEHPKVPSSWEDMCVPDNLRETFDKQPFLLAEQTIEGREEKIIVFCSSRQKQEGYIYV